MDRESDHEEMESKDQGENGAESEEDSDNMDSHTAFMRKLQNELSQKQRSDEPVDVEELRRLYEANNNTSTSNNNNTSANRSNNSSNSSANSASGNGGGNNGISAVHLAAAAAVAAQHRPPSCPGNTNATVPTSYSNFPSLPPDRLFQYGLTYAAFQQSYPGNALNNLAVGLQSAGMLQAGTSFQSLPSSRIPSPNLHQSQFQRQNSSPPPSQNYNRSPPNFQSPEPALHKRSASISSRHSREESTSPIHQNSWSFEEQFKQLYDIDRDDPARKEFLDDLFSFMQKHETPVTRLPIMAKSVLDLYELYKLVVQRGGLVDVINKKLWQEVIKGLNLPSSITSAAFTLRTQYMKFLYRYECHKLHLSTPAELQTAIEGNKREGRRTSYYGELGQMQSPNSNGAGTNNGGHLNNSMHHSQSQMSPVSLVTTSTAGGHNRLHLNGHSNQFANIAGNPSIPNAHGINPLVLSGAPVPVSPESRIMAEYVKLLSGRTMNGTSLNGTGSSPDLPEPPANIPLDAMAFWSLYKDVMKQPFSQSSVLNSFPPVRPHSQNSTNEVPLDLGKSNRKREGEFIETPFAVKKQPCDTDLPDNDDQNETEVSESESEDEPKFQISLKNSSQDNSEDTKLSSMTVKIKFNGVKYKGILHKYA